MKEKNPLTSDHLDESEWNQSWRKKVMKHERKRAVEENTVSQRSSRYKGHY